MTEHRPFAVGDIVFVTGGWAPHPPRRVNKVLKRYVELDDGSKWTQRGDPYPRESYPRTQLEHSTPSLIEQYRRHLYRSKLEAAIKDERLTSATLRSALLVLRTALTGTDA